MIAVADYEKCHLLLPCSGANGGTSFPDLSLRNRTLTVSGNAQTSTAQSRYYGSSAYFDGNGDMLTLATDSVGGFNFGTGDFTIAFWHRPDTGSVGAFACALATNTTSYVSAATCLVLGPSLYPRITGNGKTGRQAGSPLPQGSWSHVAITRSGSTLRFFLNGQPDGAVTDTQSWNFDSSGMVIGRAKWDSGGAYMKGYLQDLMIVKGVAVWTAAFTPAQIAGTISNTGSGVEPIKDYTGVAAVRSIRAFQRAMSGPRVFSTASDADGRYTLQLPMLEHSAIFEDATVGQAYPDLLVSRAVPA